MHNQYTSPFSWRYGSDQMRQIWSENHKRQLWRRIWVALATAQQSASLVTAEQVDELLQHKNDIDIERANQIEDEIHHDLMAEVLTYAEQCPLAGGIIHLGATSMDIIDNADALRLRSSLKILLENLSALLSELADKIEQQADHVCMAFTHLQPAEPTTVGYRLANYAQDLLADWQALKLVSENIRGKGLKGAVGTSASYTVLLEDSNMAASDLEAQVMAALGLDAYPVTHQTYPRHQDWEIVNALAGIAMSLYRLAFDMRLLQSPPFGEWAEPFGSKQIGSSAMPFKRNPINAENIDSLARFVATLPRVAWDNAAHCLLERTLDDSGNRRIVLPEAFLATDELLIRSHKILDGLRINDDVIQRNLDKYGVFAATERLLMVAVRVGGNRQELHEVIRENSLIAWEAIRRGEDNPLIDLLVNDVRIASLMDSQQVLELLNVEDYIGDAAERSRDMVVTIRETIG
jgi:adenylosuccinate lyase